MSSCQFTPQAIDDLFEIWSYIARDSVEAANRLEDAVYEACAFLGEGPLRGKTREDLTNLPLRFWTVQAPSELHHRLRSQEPPSANYPDPSR